MYRKAVLQDCEAVYNLICDMESTELPYERFREIFCSQLEDGSYFCLVREEEDRVIAALNLRFEEQLHHAERIAEIMEFAVLEEFRNKGVGKDMLKQARLIAKNQGCTQIEVACNQLRKDTHRFYLREGMHNFHFKFSEPLTGNRNAKNAIGR